MSNTYKELDRPYVAQQLDGPIIKAVIKAVYNFLHKDIDEHVSYFKTLSIDTANTDHLFFIGKLMGLQLFTLFTDAGAGKYITFTDEYYDAEEFGYNNGWSNDYHEYEEGAGVFATGAEKDFPVSLTDDQYRRILEALAQIPSASADSIFMIDTLTHAFLDSSDYTINYNEGYKDVVNVVIGESISVRYISMLDAMFARLLKGGTIVLVTHI